MFIPLCRIEVRENVKKAVDRVLKSNRFILGKETELFESEFANFIGTRYAVAVSSGTAALFLSLKALGIGRGHKVILPAMTFIATQHAIEMAGATPAFADIDLETCNISFEEITKKITKTVKAIVLVHLYGNPVWFKEFDCSRWKIPIIEDACQAHGAQAYFRKTGALGELGCFSFYPSKCLTTLSDGGMVTTDSEFLARSIRATRNQGREGKKAFLSKGFNLRMSEMSAAIGRANLQFLECCDNVIREKMASTYAEFLPRNVKLPPNSFLRVWTYYVIRIRNRNKKFLELRDKGIQTGIHFPRPLAPLKNAKILSRTCLSLPMSAFLAESEVREVCSCF